MYIIIDGCNVLRSGDAGHQPVSQQKRDAFLIELQRYSKEKKHEVVVVFDGGFSFRPGYSRAGKILVWDSGINYSADDVIYDLLDEVGYPFETLLVSSDRELTNYAEDRNVVSIDAPLFRVLLHQVKNSRGPKKIEQQGYVCFGPERPELDALMKMGPKKIFDKDARGPEVKSMVDRFLLESPYKKGTKIERRLLRILEKL